MGWNDHSDDDNEVSNLPPEAFDIWNVDGPFEPQGHWLRIASEDHQMIAIRAWFRARYADPADSTPYNGREGGYQFINGGPYDPADVIPRRFAQDVTEDVLQKVIDELHEEVGDEWAPLQLSGPSDYDPDYGVVVEESGQPLARLKERLEQSRQVLTLQGEQAAQFLARKLAFGSVITSLESFLWETVSYWIDHDEATVHNIVKSIPHFRDQPMKLGDIVERHKSLPNEVKGYLQNLVWHQWDKVAPLFSRGLQIEIASFKQFDAALLKRHDIVHRSGFTKEGEIVTIQFAEIEELCVRVLAFAEAIAKQLEARKQTIQAR